MSFKLSFHEEAQKEYENSVEWYLERSYQAAIGFINAVDIATRKLCIYPKRYRNTYKQFYEIGLKKYPFILIYTVEEERQMVIIWKLFHHKQHPRKKYKGLK